MRLKWLIFFPLAQSSWDVNHWLANLNQGRSHFAHDIQSSYEYLIHYQSEDSYAHEMIIPSPPYPNYVDCWTQNGYHNLST